VLYCVLHYVLYEIPVKIKLNYESINSLYSNALSVDDAASCCSRDYVNVDQIYYANAAVSAALA